MALKYCPACDEDCDVDEEVTICTECGGPLEAAEDGDKDGGVWEDGDGDGDGDGDWGEE